jgi:hypothetical protein
MKKIQFGFILTFILFNFSLPAFAEEVKDFSAVKGESIQGLKKDIQKAQKQIDCIEKSKDLSEIDYCKNSARIDTAIDVISDGLKNDKIKNLFGGNTN